MSTNAQLTQQINGLLVAWNTREAQFRAWLAGTPTGGPNSDGRYPLTDANGTTQLVDCPAKLASSVEGPAGLSVAAKLTSEAARDTAIAARDRAITAETAATGMNSQTLAYRNTAKIYRDDAAAFAAGLSAAKTAALAAQTAAEAAQGVATQKADEAALSEASAADSAAAAALSAAAAATFDPLSYYTKTQSDARYKAVAYVPSWSEITGKPATFAPSAHTHTIGDVTGLQAALDGKQAAGSYAAATHAHTIANITGLQAALDGKQPTGSYLTGITSGMVTAALGYAPANRVDFDVSDASPTFSSSSFQYHYHQSPHIAFVKKSGGFSWYWRRNDTGLSGGANEVEDMSLTEAGDLVVRSSVRAPIFYDANDMAFYLNPNGTSALNGLTLSGLLVGRVSSGTNVNSMNDTGSFSVRGDVNNAASMTFHRTGAYAINMGLGTDNVFRIGGFSAQGNCLQIYGSGAVQALNDFRAPIFYDSDNTAFYTNPAGTSVMSSIALGGAASVPQGVLWMSGEAWISGNGNRVAFTTDGSTDNIPNVSLRGSTNDLVVQNWSGSASQDNFWVFGASRDAACAGNFTAYYSDERLKTKTGTLENALDKVLSLEGFTYVENEVARSVGYCNDKQQVGLSAQGVQAVLPEAVSLAPFDYDVRPDGTVVSKSGQNYLTVDYSRVVPLLIEAIKELTAKVAELKETRTCT